MAGLGVEVGSRRGANTGKLPRGELQSRGGESLGCWAESPVRFPTPTSTQQLTFRDLLDPQRSGRYFERHTLVISGNPSALPEYS